MLNETEHYIFLISIPILTGITTAFEETMELIYFIIFIGFIISLIGIIFCTVIFLIFFIIELFGDLKSLFNIRSVICILVSISILVIGLYILSLFIQYFEYILNMDNILMSILFSLS